MSMKPYEVVKAFAFTKGDSSVNVPAEKATIIADGEFLIDLDTVAKEARKEVMELFRSKLQEAFEIIWSEPVRIAFDYELQAGD